MFNPIRVVIRGIVPVKDQRLINQMYVKPLNPYKSISRQSVRSDKFKSLKDDLGD